MCAIPNPQPQKSTSSNAKSQAPKKEPKWMIMKRQNKSSVNKMQKTTDKPSVSAQKPNQQSREEKRKRWAKKAKPVAKPSVKRSSVYEYVSVCCSIPCSKPRAGEKTAQVDPETGKTSKKDRALGLGHWRCNGVGGCKKSCKVTRKVPTASTTQPTVGGTVPDITYPAPLSTPEITDAPTA